MNFFGVLGQLGRLLPGYLEGERAAIKDNWQDLQNYNNVQHGQLQNAFDISTWNPQVTREYLSTGMLQNAAQLSSKNLFDTLAAWPGTLATIQANNANAGNLANSNAQVKLASNQATLGAIPLLQQAIAQSLQPLPNAVGTPLQGTTTSPLNLDLSALLRQITGGV